MWGLQSMGSPITWGKLHPITCKGTQIYGDGQGESPCPFSYMRTIFSYEYYHLNYKVL